MQDHFVMKTKVEKNVVEKSISVPDKVVVELSLEHAILIYGLLSQTNGKLCYPIYEQFLNILGDQFPQVSNTMIDVNAREKLGLAKEIQEIVNIIQQRHSIVNN